ncbi:MAG TPA: hypothetical protein VKA48_05900 [Gammaproteobacteria bacterium]|nr:hypothetical protein [Gammaproteobacteria bacterium]
MHPEGTRAEQPASTVDLVRIQVLDKIAGRRRTMSLPLGKTIPLPDAVHRIRAVRYTPDFALANPPHEGSGTPSGKTAAKDPGDSPEKSPSGSAQDSGNPGTKAKAKPPKAVPRKDGEGNPAVLLKLYRDDQVVGETWLFLHATYLFQPSNMRYTFRLLGAVKGRDDQKSARSSAG